MPELPTKLYERFRKWNLRNALKSNFGVELEQGIREIMVYGLRSEVSRYGVGGYVSVEADYRDSGTYVTAGLKKVGIRDAANIYKTGGQLPPTIDIKVERLVDEFVYDVVEEGKGDRLYEMLKKHEKLSKEIVRELGFREAHFKDSARYLVERLYQWKAETEKISEPEKVLAAGAEAARKRLLPITAVVIFSFLLAIFFLNNYSTFIGSQNITGNVPLVVTIGNWSLIIILSILVVYIIFKLKNR